ncbi:hypothetical protein K439DRAFT_1616642 [Ramaria rubella]|nr:hypothetical protein K439DRAFT_1616642 [Ramaria rubella]
MPLNFEQLGALLEARQILNEAGILESNESINEPDILHLWNILDSHLPAGSHPLIQLSQYSPALAVPFTEEEMACGGNQVNWKTTVHVIVEHPAGAVIEFPQTDLNSPFVNPTENIQYSLGDSHGGHANIMCRLLYDTEYQAPVSCYHLKTSCCCIKYCSFNHDSQAEFREHSDIPQSSLLPSSGRSDTAGEHGCPCPAEVEHGNHSNTPAHLGTFKEEEVFSQYFEEEPEGSGDFYEGFQDL